jgi:hypothetical protein
MVRPHLRLCLASPILAGRMFRVATSHHAQMPGCFPCLALTCLFVCLPLFSWPRHALFAGLPTLPGRASHYLPKCFPCLACTQLAAPSFLPALTDIALPLLDCLPVSLPWSHLYAGLPPLLLVVSGACLPSLASPTCLSWPRLLPALPLPCRALSHHCAM